MPRESTEAGPTIREGFPYLHVRGAAAAIDFYKSVFGAEELVRVPGTSGRIGHAELRFGPMMLLLADEYPELGVRGPLAYGGTGTSTRSNHH